MSGEKDLEVLIRSLSASLAEGLFVFVSLRGGPIPAGLTTQMIFHEAEGDTLIVLKSDAQAYGLDYEFPSRMITLNIHSSLEAVGFMARITTELARLGMGVNPVSGFFHDHLFIPDGRELEAMAALNRLANGGS